MLYYELISTNFTAGTLFQPQTFDADDINQYFNLFSLAQFYNDEGEQEGPSFKWRPCTRKDFEDVNAGFVWDKHNRKGNGKKIKKSNPNILICDNKHDEMWL